MRISVERALRVLEAQFKAIFDNAELGIAIFDLEGHLLQQNVAVDKLPNSSADSVLAAELTSIANFVRPFHEPFTREHCRTAEGCRPQWLAITYSGVYDEDVCQMVVLLIRDITEDRLLSQQLAYDASHDGLTGIANRAAFEVALREQLLDASSGNLFALMYIELDSFTPINDTFGHRAGDHVLIAVAQRLRSAVSAEDIRARSGGDEFCHLSARG